MHLLLRHRADKSLYYLVLSVFVLATTACPEQSTSLRGAGSNSVEERLLKKFAEKDCRDEGPRDSLGGRHCGLAQCLGERKWLCADY